MPVTTYRFTVVEEVPGAAALLAGVPTSASVNYPGAVEFPSAVRTWASPHWASVRVIAVGDDDAEAKAQERLDAQRAENAANVVGTLSAEGW